METIDPDYREKALRFLVNCVEMEAGLEKEERRAVGRVVDALVKEEGWTEEELGLAKEEWEKFVEKVKA